MFHRLRALAFGLTFAAGLGLAEPAAGGEARRAPLPRPGKIVCLVCVPGSALS